MTEGKMKIETEPVVADASTDEEEVELTYEELLPYLLLPMAGAY
jgi:hypothetical protein